MKPSSAIEVIGAVGLFGAGFWWQEMSVVNT